MSYWFGLHYDVCWRALYHVVRCIVLHYVAGCRVVLGYVLAYRVVVYCAVL